MPWTWLQGDMNNILAWLCSSFSSPPFSRTAVGLTLLMKWQSLEGFPKWALVRADHHSWGHNPYSHQPSLPLRVAAK